MPPTVWVSVNGVVSPAEDARLSVLDHGFLYGDSVYETLRTYRGRPFLLEPHLERLSRSAAGLRLRTDVRLDEVGRQIDRVLAAARFPESVVRVVWTRGPGDMAYDLDETQASTVVVIARSWTDYSPEQYRQGQRVARVQVQRNPIASLDPRLKTSNLLNPRLAYLEARRQGAHEAVMLTHEGLVAEGSRANIFLVSGGRVRTPAVDTGILDGITRRLTLQLCRDHGVAAGEEALPAAVLESCDEAFLTSTTMGIMPVTTIDARTVGNGGPGPVTERLMRAYDAFVATEPWTLRGLVGTH